jgi:hypothetical protein
MRTIQDDTFENFKMKKLFSIDIFLKNLNYLFIKFILLAELVLFINLILLLILMCEESLSSTKDILGY